MQLEQDQQSRTSPRRVQVALGMLLVLLPLLLYLPVLHHDFLRLWDDDTYVLDNPHARTGLTLANVRWAFTSFEQSNWHPVTWLSHILDCQLFGLNAEAQHGANLVLHLANVWLLFWLLQKATGQLWRFPYLAVGWLFFFISLVPVIGIVQVGFQGMADRYTYVPAIGLLIGLVWGLADAVQGVPAARVPVSAAVYAVIALCITTAHYVRDWQNPVTLFAHARTSWGGPDMWLEQLYGNALFSAGRIDEALEHYQASCAIQPRTEYCHYNIAHILSGRGQFREAIREYNLALQYTANRDMALLCLNELREAELQIGDYVAAENSVARALAIDPTDSTAQQLRQQILQRKGGAN
jgi:tetratricopeptide (TPR) repeat protein